MVGNGACPQMGRSFRPSGLSSHGILLFGLREALREFTDVTGGDQLMHTGVTARRQCPVIACCAATPNQPLRVPAPEPLELSILVARAGTGGHGRGRRHNERADEAGLAACAWQLLPRGGICDTRGQGVRRAGFGWPGTADCRSSRLPPGRSGVEHVRRTVTTAPPAQRDQPGRNSAAPRITGPGRGEGRAR